ncbi:MAG TPA: hypothetical protein VEC38_10175 [Candidatus Binataceae bacterium]|nr:hypothetical protein [Candidatus Binataceae bacterium]
MTPHPHGSIAALARASVPLAALSTARRGISPLGALAGAVSAADPLNRAIARTKQLKDSAARAAGNGDALARLSAATAPARQSALSQFLAGAPPLAGDGRTSGRLEPAEFARSDSSAYAGLLRAIELAWNGLRQMAAGMWKTPDLRGASIAPARGILSSAAALKSDSTLSVASMLGRRVARVEAGSAIPIASARSPDLFAPQMAHGAIADARIFRASSDAAQLARLSASARDLQRAARLAAANFSGLRAAIDAPRMADVRAISAPANIRAGAEAARGIGRIRASLGAGPARADRAQRAARAISRSLSFGQAHPSGALLARGAFGGTGALPITLNSSPSITINVPPGRAGMNPAEINRAVGDALDKHADRIYEMLRRVAAQRERTEF